MRIVRRSELVETPWKNGGGITRDIASETVGDVVLWRLSMADVGADGPFSSFAGLTRILTVIEGDGLILQGPDGDLTVGYARPVTFDGGGAVSARLTSGPIRDFNLMYDTARYDAHAEVMHGPSDIQYGGTRRTLVIHTIAGAARLGEMASLGTGDSAIIGNAPVQLGLGAGDVALCIVLRVADQTDASKSATAAR